MNPSSIDHADRCHADWEAHEPSALPIVDDLRSLIHSDAHLRKFGDSVSVEAAQSERFNLSVSLHGEN